MRPRGRILSGAGLAEAEELKVQHREELIADRTRGGECLLKHRVRLREAALRSRGETKPGQGLADAEQVAGRPRYRQRVFE